MPVFSAPPGVQLLLKSPTNETLAVLADSNKSGILLNARVTVLNQGGVDEFSFDLPKTFDLPLGRNTRCHFYVNNTLWFIGLVKEIPLADQDAPTLTIVGEGFYKRLKSKIVTATYTSETLENIVKGIMSANLGADLGVTYDASKIDVPVISGIDVEYKDVDLLKVAKEMTQAANFDYANDKYRFFVDNDGDFAIENLSPQTKRAIFEGYQYQKPEVSEDTSKMVNRIQVYRVVQGSSKDVELVNTYDQLDSQSKYGIFEKKLTFENYLNSTIVQSIVDGIFDERALPQPKVGIENFEIDAPLEFGEYHVANRRRPYWLVVNDCDSLDGWDVSQLSVTVATIDATRVLTGRQSIKLTLGDGSSGEYLEYTLDDPIPFPNLGRVFAYFDSVTPNIAITFYSTEGAEVTLKFGQINELLDADTNLEGFEVYDGTVVDDFEVKYVSGATQSFQVIAATEAMDVATDLGAESFDVEYASGEVDSFTIVDGLTFVEIVEANQPPVDDIEVSVLNGSIVNQWVRLQEDIELRTGLDSFDVYDGTVVDSFEVEYSSGETDSFDVSELLRQGVLNIKRVRVTLLSNAVATFWLDRLDCRAAITRARRLQLEEVEYVLSSVGLFANLSLGERADSVFTEIEERVEQGDVAYNIAASQ